MKKIAKAFNRRVLAVGAIIVLGIMVVASVVMVVRHMGKEKLKSSNIIQKAQVKTDEMGTISHEESKGWKEGRIIYHGDIYDYNEDITTILVMGIDKAEEGVGENFGKEDGGQADALFLLVINPHDESLKIIGINRNTMADVDLYDEYGNYENTIIAQIAVQHGFGDTPKKSCELQKLAVSKLFYSLPIHAYAAMNMSAISVLNDFVGGVDIIPEQDFVSGNYSIEAGKPTHLDDDMAYAYLQERDTNQAGSADFRLMRQKEYLQGFMKKARATLKENPSLVMDLFNSLESEMTTDMSADEVFYISSTTKRYSFDDNNFILLKGVTIVGDVFEEFYPDSDALLEMTIETFYEKVDGK